MNTDKIQNSKTKKAKKCSLKSSLKCSLCDKSSVVIQSEEPLPLMTQFEKPEDYLRARIQYLKQTERHFSVLKETKKLRKVSPTLITLILQNKRKISLDRVDEMSKLLRLSAAEKLYFKNWILKSEAPQDERAIDRIVNRNSNSNKKEFSPSLLNRWLNVYVKDAFQLSKIQADPTKIYDYLIAIANKNSIDQSIQFLLKEGYLRRTLEGKIVPDARLHSNENPPSGNQIRSFHKAALKIAQQNIDNYSAQERFANALILDLTPEKHQELISLIKVFTDSLQEFASNNTDQGDKLYQLVLNVSPLGGPKA